MLRTHRHSEIMRLLRAEGPTAVADLAATLGVSAATIRRDLAELGTQGTLRRVRGGAQVLTDEDSTRPFEQVATCDTEDKAAVAEKAAELVSDGDVLLLDVGTTVACLARALRRRPVTVITSSLAVLDVLRDDPRVELVLLGGVVRQSYLSMVGLLTETGLGQVRADLAFLGTSGVRLDGEVLDTTQVEVPVKRAMMAAADRSVLLADRHKFPGMGALKVCHVADLETLVTNEGLDQTVLESPAFSGVEVLYG
jgi:DeoR/GlpR family transcriptional regulator of sugar metabolism